MHENEMLLMLSSMKLSEYKVMQKVLRVLMSVGIDHFTALSIILDGMRKRRENYNDIRIARVK
jgi:hypothetical protein